MDYRSLVSRADLVYPQPVERSEEGMPLGNGRMGSLIWTTPAALKFQVNRVDVQPISSGTNSFFERNTDYMGGCGFVDIELGATADVLPAAGTTQHLSVYDALMHVQGRDVSARLLAWHARDVMAIEIDDQRAVPEPIQVNVRMLRFASQYAGAELESSLRAGPSRSARGTQARRPWSSWSTTIVGPCPVRMAGRTTSAKGTSARAIVRGDTPRIRARVARHGGHGVT